MTSETALVAVDVRQSLLPSPLHTVIIRDESSEGDPQFHLIRWWSKADAGHCQLCPVCSAHEGPAGVNHSGRKCRTSICALSFDGEIADSSAPLFRMPVIVATEAANVG